MPATQYSEQLRDDIALYIKNTGDITGAFIPHVSRATYYKWMKDRPDFKEAVNSSLSEWRATRTEELIPLAKAWLKKYLEEGLVIRSQVQQVTTDPDGRRWQTVKGIETRKPCPMQIIERVLGFESQNEQSIAGEPIEIEFIEVERAGINAEAEAS